MKRLRRYVSTALLAVVSGCSAAGGMGTTVPSAQRLPAVSMARPLGVTSAAAAAAVMIDAGGAAAGTWSADKAFGGGWTGSTARAVDTSRVINPAPQAVYQTSRYGNFSYTVTGLVPNASYTVRLHFSENFWTAAGKRLFDVALNGTTVLKNFDVFKDSGGRYVADTKTFSEPADANGKLAVAFKTIIDNALLAGIEVSSNPAPAAVAATPAPPASTSAPAVPSTNVAMYDGCTIGAPGDAYNADVTNAAVDPYSAAMIASQTSVDSSSFAVETYFGEEKINLDEGDTATKYPVTGNPSYHPAPAGNWPWSSGYYIENNGVGDAHSFVLDSPAKPNGCIDYEAYSTAFTGTAVSWYNGIMWPLGQAYESPLGLGYPNASSPQASGLSMFFGLVKLDEIAGANLDHAINLDAKAGSLGNCFVAPAGTSAGTAYTGTGTAHQLCFGAHLRLHPTFASAPCAASTQAAHIVYGLQHYGGYESDTGSQGNGIYPADSNTANVWDTTGVSACLATIHMSDFDVLAPA